MSVATLKFSCGQGVLNILLGTFFSICSAYDDYLEDIRGTNPLIDVKMRYGLPTAVQFTHQLCSAGSTFPNHGNHVAQGVTLVFQLDHSAIRTTCSNQLAISGSFPEGQLSSLVYNSAGCELTCLWRMVSSHSNRPLSLACFSCLVTSAVLSLFSLIVGSFLG